MSNFINNFKKHFLKVHKKCIQKNIINSDINFEKIYFNIPDNDSRGHISTNAAFIYKRHSSLNINEITKFIYNELISNRIIQDISIAGGGFINFTLSKNYLIEELHKINNLNNKFGSSNLGKNKKVNIEFISANPTGPLHIAHSRGAIFGDVLSNLLQKVGYEVTREYYLNDFGKQIELLGKSLYYRYEQALKINNELKIEYYPGKYLIDIAKKIIIRDGKKWIQAKPNKRKQFFESFATKEILKIIKKDLKNINICFDNFISEKKIVDKKLINEVFKKLDKKNLLYKGVLDKPKSQIESDWEPRKQLLFKSSNFGDDSDRPFLKSNNEWTYFANDSAYHYDKLLRGYDKLINIWGSDHIGYVKRMQSIVSALSDNKVNLIIKICQLVHLKKNNKPIKISKRTGNFISIEEIVNEVGSDVLRFFMLYRKNDAQMDFDLAKVIEKTKENPIFYIQYAYARSNSVLNIAEKKFKKINIGKKINKNFFIKNISYFEWKIIIKILSWPDIVENAAKTEEPHKIVYYLENLSTLFHSFWNQGKDDKNLRFIDEDNIDKTIVKLYWIKSMQVVYRSAFKILGIRALKKM